MNHVVYDQLLFQCISNFSFIIHEKLPTKYYNNNINNFLINNSNNNNLILY